MTPGPYIHIGGDEVKTLTEAEYATFVERVLAIVARHGKQAVGWEEIAQARLAPATVVQIWRVMRNDQSHASAAAASAVRQGARLVLSPASRVYLDMKYTPDTVLGLKWAGFVELRDAYDWDPAAMFPGVSEASVAGVEAPLWTETIVTMADIERMVLPRLPAVAEVGWSSQTARSWASFSERIALHGARWEAMGLAYYASPQVEWFGGPRRP
jgi:hexosaminidase